VSAARRILKGEPAMIRGPFPQRKAAKPEATFCAKWT
jgi:hypothetical protein